MTTEGCKLKLYFFTSVVMIANKKVVEGNYFFQVVNKSYLIFVIAVIFP